MKTSNELPRLAVVGLGKLGLPWACVLASRGYDILGIDTNQRHVQSLRAEEFATDEPQVIRMLVCARDRLQFADDFQGIGTTRMAFVVVPTPSGEDDRFSLEYVIPAVRQIAGRVAKCERPYTIVIVSTVMPGDCRGPISAAIRSVAGAAADQIRLVYSPEFVALGDVVDGMRCPDLTLIGAPDHHWAQDVCGVYQSVLENEPTRVVCSWESAEIAKLAINCCVATKIACVNLLGQICQRTEGADVDDVSRALSADPRIGEKCTTAGLGFGGPCLPRDVRALSSVCRRASVDAGIPRAVDRLNRAAPALASSFVLSCPPEGSAVGILGLTYRVGTSLVECSQALELARLLGESQLSVFAFDPWQDAIDQARIRDSGITLCDSPTGVLRAATRIVVATPDPYFHTLDHNHLAAKVLIDLWRVVNPDLVRFMRNRADAGGTSFRYVPFGAEFSASGLGMGGPNAKLKATVVSE